MARFCLACGTALEEAPAGGEERKVVSVVFVDLVGFTADADQADPEDVRARLRPFHARVKGELERFGGTVEKFVGDAVMAVFGAPVAHEDDAERAVRSGFAILEAVDELGLQARAAVNTGEAVVTLGAQPAAVCTCIQLCPLAAGQLCPSPGWPAEPTALVQSAHVRLFPDSSMPVEVEPVSVSWLSGQLLVQPGIPSW